VCQFEDAKRLKDKKQIMIVVTAVSRKAIGNNKSCTVNRIGKNGNNRIEGSA
jgi:hypothetical protein